MINLKRMVKQLPFLVWMLLLSNLVFFTARFMAMPFMAIYFSGKLSLSPAEVGLLIGISPLSQMVLGVLGGRLSDKIGVHRIYPFAFIIPAISLIGYIAFSNFYVIAFFSILAGFGWSMYNSASNVLLSNYTPEPLIEKVYSYNYWGVNLGGMLGPLVGVLFLGAGSSGLPILVFSFLLIIIAFAMFILFKIKIKDKPSESNKDEEVIYPKESMFKQLSKSGVLVWLTISYFLIFFIESQQETNIAQILNRSFENGVEIFGILLTMNTAIIVILQPITAQFIDKLKVKWVIIAGNLLYIMGFVLLSFLNQLIWVWYLSFAFITIGELIIAPKIQGMIAKSAPSNQKATYFSILQMGGNFAFVIGPWLGGLILTFASVNYLMLLLVLVSLIQLITILLAYKSFFKSSKLDQRVNYKYNM